MTKIGNVAYAGLALTLLVTLSACGGGGDGSDSAGVNPPAANVPPPASGSGSNRAPTIQGQAATSVVAGQSYTFEPTASDPDGDALTFSATNLPAWATLNAATGRISGTPTAADVSNFTGITITVSDGRTSASLAPFNVAVTQIGTGSATLSWSPPMQNTDGSVLQNLAGYEVLWGRSPDALDQHATLNNPSLSTYVVGNLSPGTWYFAVVAINSDGASSAPSQVASKAIS